MKLRHRARGLRAGSLHSVETERPNLVLVKEGFSMRLSVIALPLMVLCLFALLLTGCPKPAQQAAPPTPVGGPAAPEEKGLAKSRAPSKPPPASPSSSAASSPSPAAGAPLGEPEKATAVMVEKQVNDSGGINGRPLKIIIEDDASRGRQGRAGRQEAHRAGQGRGHRRPDAQRHEHGHRRPLHRGQIPLVSCAASAQITSPSLRQVGLLQRPDRRAGRRSGWWTT